MHISLEGKVALVTGRIEGHRQGDRRIVRRRGRQGDARLAQAGSAREAAAEIERRRRAVFAANAGDIDAGRGVRAATIERFGGLDILVNNAATNPYYGPTLGVDPARFDKTFQVNLRGPLFWCQAAWEPGDAGQARRDHQHRLGRRACAPRAGSASTTSPRPR